MDELDKKVIKNIQNGLKNRDQFMHDLTDHLGLVAVYNHKTRRYDFTKRQPKTPKQIQDEFMVTPDEDSLKPGQSGPGRPKKT